VLFLSLVNLMAYMLAGGNAAALGGGLAPVMP
jgi:hypothetical protein